MPGTFKKRNYQMIKIQIIPANGEQKTFQSYHEVCDYINTLEKQKILEPGTKIWSFIRRRYKTLHSLYYRNPSLKGYLTLREKEAVEKEMGLVEIVKGNREHITQLLCMNRLDIEPLKRDWCKEYCLEHGIKISEWVLSE
jgi:hypothetical protein